MRFKKGDEIKAIDSGLKTKIIMVGTLYYALEGFFSDAKIYTRIDYVDRAFKLINKG